MRWLALLVPLQLSTASAAPCGDKVPPQGLCVTPMLVTWCEDGDIKTLECKKGTVCAWNGPLAAFDCVPDACKDVPPEGRCKAADTVEWCESGQPKTLKCAEGTYCGRSKELFDCLKSSQADEVTTPDAPDAGAAQDATGDDAGAASDVRSGSDSAPLLPPPSFEVSDGADAGGYGKMATGPGGCAAAPGAAGGVWMLMLLVLALKVRG